MSLAGKRVLVAIGGGIAAFKAVELVRELQRRGAKVRVVMTEAATHFVGAVTFAGITGEAAITDLWDPTYAGEVHVELGAWAEAIVVAPATANLLARAAHGLADDAVLATLAASDARVFFAPAMHSKMWRREATQEHTAKLVARGARMLGPTEGPLASGEVGEGRMLEPKELADALERALAPAERPWSGKRVLITAGPTHEAIDPVRYIANRSSGKMGFALAEAARTRGAEVTLVLGPVEAAPPVGVAVERVVSARDMHRAVMARALDSDLVIMAAAVA
ncbi:MAG: bifunctional phosphopantothenoylcysteine decarboxylase/phosphopantothenate--cysteine ligase CoaBC, partial [Myxococcales bacterium]|nr:bifunctional phosphopantothenoylcysteine decarboxylase/phosphopantothenate--cysteine ligase CoaBC [Myxococcales bacterium]